MTNHIRFFSRQKPYLFHIAIMASVITFCHPDRVEAAQTINTTSTTSCSAQGGTLVGGNILTDFDNGTFGTENGSADQSPGTDPYPGQITSGVFADFYSFFYGAFGYIANAVTPRNSFQHPDITDPVYGAIGRFFASDPNANTPVINFTALNVDQDENYQLSFWAANSEPNGAPNDINIEIDGIVAFNTGPLLAFASALEWKKYSIVFHSGNQSTVLIALRSLETGQGGRDFYLDNVEMQRCSLSGRNIAGTQYSDVDRNNIWQAAREAGLASIGVALYDTRGDANATNDIYVGTTDSIADGSFEFINLPLNSNYELRVAQTDADLPNGSTLGTASTLSVNLGSSSDSTDNDFGFDIPRPDLTVSKSSTVYSSVASTGLSIPGEDAEYVIEITNNGGEGMDVDSLLVVDSLPATLSFYNDDFDGVGGITNEPMIFSQTGSGLDFEFARDVGFSDSATKPASFSECNYNPADGYDPNISYICINPKGLFLDGASTASFSLRFRAKIK